MHLEERRQRRCDLTVTQRVLLHHTFFPFETLLLYAGKILYLLVVASNIPLRLPAKGEYTFFAKVRLSNLRDLFSL